MPTPIDLSEVIEDAITDSTITEDTPSTEQTDSFVAEETPTEAPVEASEVVEGQEDSEPQSEVEQFTDGLGQPAQFAMDKKLGIPSHTNGRENRIPYSRVKKIVEGAEKRALEPLQKQLAELTPRVQEYEQRLAQVAEFEQVMTNDPGRFLDMLSTLPAYSQFFQMMEQFVTSQSHGGAAPPTTEQQAQAILDNDPMPEPDNEDGSGYTMDGLKKLLEWNSRVVEGKVSQRFEQQYKPIKDRFDAEQTLQQLTPKIQKQMEEAYTWPKFSENEAEIVKVLERYPTATLEQAYQHVVVPKLVADEQKLRSDIRQQVLGELKKAPPVSTGVPVSGTKPNPANLNSGPRNLEDVIQQAVQERGLR